jgi:diguanylate cyclase (GGDEF)-like protein/PAS domain S-box-containing protein
VATAESRMGPPDGQEIWRGFDGVLFDRAPNGIVVLDATGRIVAANPAACALLDRPHAELSTLAFTALVHPDDPPSPHLGDGDAPVEHRYRILTSNGPVKRLRARIVADNGLRILYLDDLSEELQRIDDARAAVGSRYENLMRRIGDVIALCDENGVVLNVLGASDGILGWPVARWLGQNVLAFAHPDEVDAIRIGYASLLETPGLPIVREFRTLSETGRWAWLQFNATNLLDDPTVRAVVLVMRNVTRKREMARLQEAQAEVLEMIACSIPLETILTRLGALVEGQVLRSTARVAFGAHLGRAETKPTTISVPLSPEGLTGTPAPRLIVELDEQRALTELEDVVVLAAARLAEIALQRDQSQNQLTHLAHHDRLTGLPNRLRMQTQLDAGIGRAKAYGTALAVLFLDIDNFKIINDSLGHSVGDDVLVAFGSRVAETLRPHDTIGRFGGDEFVILLQDIADTADAVAVAERLLEGLAEPLRIGEHNLFLSVSVGIAVSIAGQDSADELLHRADAAMYQAKAKGRSRVQLFSDELSRLSKGRLRLEGDLHRALDTNQFVLHWQPKVAFDTGRIVSVEALVRWNHPERGLLQPPDFIRVSEETELIVRLGAWVMDEAIRHHAIWEAEHGDEAPWSIAVNVSALQLAQPAALERVLKSLDRWNWSPDRLVLELTESVLMDGSASASPILHALQVAGVKIAIDDFGTGFASLSYLHRYPVDQVKLDQSFVRDIDGNGEGSAIARAVIDMAHALGITVTAEGVETPAQWSGLRALGCDRAQGFYLSPPLDDVAFAALLRTRPRY